MIHSLSIGIVEEKRKMRYIQKYYETNIDLEIPGIQHGYLLIGGSYVGVILEDAVFEIIDITGKIYGVSDELARDLCEKIAGAVLRRKRHQIIKKSFHILTKWMNLCSRNMQNLKEQF